MPGPAPDNIQHNFGALDFPVPITGAGQSISDPALDYLLSFYKAILNDRGALAWKSVAPTADKTANPPVPSTYSPPVARTFANSPKEGFDAAQLPALFLSRQGSDRDPAWIADDYLITSDALSLIWIFPMAMQADARRRTNFVNAMTKAIVAATFMERDPAWVVPNDPDPLAAVHGSFLQYWVGYWKLLPQRWKAFQINTVGDDKPAPFLGIEIPLHIEERYVQPKGAGLASITANLETTDAPPFVTNTIVLTKP